ncbi:ABC transporter ATP-binding protein/permease [Paenibacillus oenotherae]|uniref:ABC transporter ATP-binding protein/permease n=1 Tax=Paenibacillus oenotherae TaxID=1435645 RepID=A0ABS7D222_9BACL|nr:ABC transporter ATP-binding protein [Paenibacillus oenotherae]MBW7473846.1 ABC transporter ATP-binding protein/permease [Paenibacillus oenotherae]
MSKVNRRIALSYTAKLLHPHKGTLLRMIGNAGIRSLLFMVPPVMMKYILEWALPRSDWNLLLIVCCCIIVAPLVGSAMIAVGTYRSKFLYRLYGQGRSDLYQRVQSRPLAWFQRRRTGDLMTRMLDDTQAVYPFVDGTVVFLIVLVFTIGIGSVVLVTLQPVLGAFIIILWATHSLLIAKLGDSVKNKTAEIQRQTSTVTETARELFSGTRWITMSGQEKRAMKLLKNCLHEEWKLARGGLLAENKLRLIDAFLHASSLVLMYYLGGRLVINGDMSLGSLVSFIAVYNWLRPLGVSAYNILISVKQTEPSIDRILDIADPLPSHKGLIPEDVLHTIQLEDVSFHYEGKSVLHGINLHISAPSVIAIIGQRGSGKSTLAELLLRLQTSSSGTIKVNGIPLDKLDEAWIRRHLLCVTQDNYIRSGTLMDNLTFGCQDVDPVSLHQAIATAELGEWIARLPDGLQTEVGEQGMALSGGERQRISIARAIVRQPSLLILDESTSALDACTEQRLLANITQSLPHTTIIFITHRMAAVQFSQHIYRLSNGTIGNDDHRC